MSYKNRLPVLGISLLADYKREYGMPSTRPDENEGDELPSSGALSLAPTSGPEVALPLVLLLSHVLVPAIRR